MDQIKTGWVKKGVLVAKFSSRELALMREMIHDKLSKENDKTTESFLNGLLKKFRGLHKCSECKQWVMSGKQHKN